MSRKLGFSRSNKGIVPDFKNRGITALGFYLNSKEFNFLTSLKFVNCGNGITRSFHC